MKEIEKEVFDIQSYGNEHYEIVVSIKDIIDHFKKIGLEPIDSQDGCNVYRIRKSWMRERTPRVTTETNRNECRLVILRPVR